MQNYPQPVLISNGSQQPFVIVDSPINLALASMSLLLMLVGTALAHRAIRLDGPKTLWDEKKYKVRNCNISKLGQEGPSDAVASPKCDCGQFLKDHKDVSRSAVNLRLFILLLATLPDILLDLFCAASFFEYLIAGTWTRRYGYSPFFFIFALSCCLLRPRPYSHLFRTWLQCPKFPIFPMRRSPFYHYTSYEEHSHTHFRKALAIATIGLIVCTLLVWILTFHRMGITRALQSSQPRVMLQLNGTYSYIESGDAYLEISPNKLFSKLSSYSGKSSHTLQAGSLMRCNKISYAQHAEVLAALNGGFANNGNNDATSVMWNDTNTTSLVCSTNATQMDTFFDAWALIMIIDLSASSLLSLVLYYRRNYEESLSWHLITVQLQLLGLFFINWLVILGRDVSFPGMTASLVWCPSFLYIDCQTLAFGQVHPFSIQQSLKWFMHLGPYPVDKVFGYGMAEYSWL